MDKKWRGGIMNHTIAKTTRPNGTEVMLCSHEASNGTITYIVKSSNSFDTRFFGVFDSAVAHYNRIVDEENAKGGWFNENN